MAQPIENLSKLEVDIFGGTYHVRAEKDSGHLRNLADLVDSKMKEVAARVTTIDTTKIAILAALNLADELVQTRSEREDERENDTTELVEKVAGMTDELQLVLDEKGR